MDKTFDLARAFERDTALLRLARESAILIHPTDIRAAGNEVERAVRDYFRRILPPQYHVTSGFLIDRQHRVSPQIDIIISGAFNVPSLYTTQDGTEYVPITSVYAIGEVKSTYYKSAGYFGKMTSDLERINVMDRPMIENTLVDGVVTDETTILDMVRPISSERYRNHLFSFLFCADSGDFEFQEIAPHLNGVHPSLVPSVTVLLDRGIIARMRINESGEGRYHKYPMEAPSPTFDWVFAESAGGDAKSKGGSNLAFLYGALIDHLSNSQLEPTDAHRYTSTLVNLRRSTLKWARGSPPKAPS